MKFNDDEEALNKSPATLPSDFLQSLTPDEQSKSTCTKRVHYVFNIIFGYISSFVIKFYDGFVLLASYGNTISNCLMIYLFHKHHNNISWFMTSLIFMLIAQLCYPTLFVLRYRSYSFICKAVKSIALFILLLPISPFVSFIFYWVSLDMNEDTIITKCLNNLGFHDEFYCATRLQRAKLMIWTQKNRIKHMGYVLQIVVESLPQLCIQLTYAILNHGKNDDDNNFNELQLWLWISIFVGVASIIIKSPMFGVGIDYRPFMLNWISFVFDFFNVFVFLFWYVFHVFIKFGFILLSCKDIISVLM